MHRPRQLLPLLVLPLRLQPGLLLFLRLPHPPPVVNHRLHIITHPPVRLQTETKPTPLHATFQLIEDLYRYDKEQVYLCPVGGGGRYLCEDDCGA